MKAFNKVLWLELLVYGAGLFLLLVVPIFLATYSIPDPFGLNVEEPPVEVSVEEPPVEVSVGGSRFTENDEVVQEAARKLKRDPKYIAERLNKLDELYKKRRG